MINVKDYLTSLTEENKEVQTPATLFTNEKGSMGTIYLFNNFGISQTDTIKLSSQITTHYMEDNVSMQDHWAIAPITYTMSGLVGELVYTPPKKWSSFVRDNFIDYLAPLSVLSPTFDNYTQSAINAVQAVEASYRRYEQIAKQVFQNFKGANTQKTNQEYLIQTLQKLRDNRQLVNVYTPYGEYNSLAIQDISGSQNSTKYQSSLEINFMQWRNVSTLTRKATNEEKAMFSQIQQASIEQSGTASTQEPDESTLRALKNQGVNIFKEAFGVKG